MRISTEIAFDAARFLPAAATGGAGPRLQGCSFRVQIILDGAVDPDRGWVADFSEVKRLCEPVRGTLTQRPLNEIPGLENPTTDMLARWIWNTLKPSLPALATIVVKEGDGGDVAYSEDRPSRPALR